MAPFPSKTCTLGAVNNWRQCLIREPGKQKEKDGGLSETAVGGEEMERGRNGMDFSGCVTHVKEREGGKVTSHSRNHS